MPRNNGASGKDEVRYRIENGTGIGDATIINKEPSLSKNSVIHALSTFRKTGHYLPLLKKGGLPKEFWHLYEKPQTTTIEAVSMLPKPATRTAPYSQFQPFRTLPYQPKNHV